MVADKRAKAMAQALQDLERNPPIGSQSLRRLLGIDELRTWRLQGFALTFRYLQRADHAEFIRWVGRRQDQGDAEV